MWKTGLQCNRLKASTTILQHEECLIGQRGKYFTHTHMYIYIYIIFIYMHVCACMYTCISNAETHTDSTLLDFRYKYWRRAHIAEGKVAVIFHAVVHNLYTFCGVTLQHTNTETLWCAQWHGRGGGRMKWNHKRHEKEEMGRNRGGGGGGGGGVPRPNTANR
jgi:hypothetical protein